MDRKTDTFFSQSQRVLVSENTRPIRRLQKLWVGVMRSCVSLAMVMYAGLTTATLDMFVFHTSVTDGRDYLKGTYLVGPSQIPPTV